MHRLARTALIALTAIAALLLAACASASTPDASTPNASATPTSSVVPAAAGDQSATADQAKAWAGKWCDVQPGMTRAQAIEIMGAPTKSFPLESGTPQLSWYAYQWAFTAFMDADDNVRQLDVNAAQLTDAEKSSITCDTTRVAK